MKANAVKIAEGVYWVGVIHWNSRTFHGYGIPGTTYNAYLVFGEEKNVLIDNTYRGLQDQLDARIEDAFAQEGKEIKIYNSRSYSQAESCGLPFHEGLENRMNRLEG